MAGGRKSTAAKKILNKAKNKSPRQSQRLVTRNEQVEIQEKQSSRHDRQRCSQEKQKQ